MKFFKRANKSDAKAESNSEAPQENAQAVNSPATAEQTIAEQSEASHSAQGQTEDPDKPGLFGRLKQGLSRSAPQELEEVVAEPVSQSPPTADSAARGDTEGQAQKQNFFSRIKQGLSRTSDQFGEGMGTLLFGKKEIDEALLEDIETQLLMADVGMDTTAKIIDDLTQRVARKQLADGEALHRALRQSLQDILGKVEAPLSISPEQRPFVLLVVGVNGVGKTTTIGKLARRFQQQGKSVMLAAGDTFRAAAVEQLQVWGERNKVPVVAQATGSDSASVIYDALQSARARDIDILIADTAGRLHTKSHLMDELAKVKRVMAKLDSRAPHEILLVLDAGTGQNALSQAQQFTDAVGVTGIALTKLDGTAKGGIIFALSDRFGIPIRYVGVGEAVEDLQAFDAQAFVAALFASAETEEANS